MYVDKLKGVGILDDLKKAFGSGGGLGTEILTSTASRQLLQRKLEEAKAGERLGKEIGCGIASAFDSAIPKAVWGTSDVQKECKPPEKGGIKISHAPNEYADFALAVANPTIKRAQRVAAGIAEPRIKARLMPWFVGLPIAGLLVGAGVTYLVMNRMRPKR